MLAPKYFFFQNKLFKKLNNRVLVSNLFSTLSYKLCYSKLHLLYTSYYYQL